MFEIVPRPGLLPNSASEIAYQRPRTLRPTRQVRARTRCRHHSGRRRITKKAFRRAQSSSNLAPPFGAGLQECERSRRSSWRTCWARPSVARSRSSMGPTPRSGSSAAAPRPPCLDSSSEAGPALPKAPRKQRIRGRSTRCTTPWASSHPRPRCARRPPLRALCLPSPPILPCTQPSNASWGFGTSTRDQRAKGASRFEPPVVPPPFPPPHAHALLALQCTPAYGNEWLR